jgi:environmental stress-induced protein Ves
MAEVRLIDSTSLKSVPWKNGLGESTVIAQNESFWKFSRTAMKDSCSMVVEPGCDVALVVLQGSTNIQHRDEASSLSLCPLTPYVYQGEWPTSLQVSGPQSHLILSINRSKAYLTMALESLTEDLSSEIHTSHKILLSHTTLLYIISGNLELTIDSTHSYQMHPHQMLWIQRQDQMSPTELMIRSLNHSEEAKVLLIQIDYKPASNDVPNPYKLTRTTTGSAFVYVERPGTERSHVDLSASTLDLTGSMTSLGSCHLESIRHYKPPSFTSRAQNESAVPPAVCRDSLNIEEFPKGIISTVWINMVKQGLSEWVRIPVIVARGIEDGPVVN